MSINNPFSKPAQKKQAPTKKVVEKDNNYHYNNPLNNNSVRIMKSEIYANTQHNLSNDKII